MHKLRELKDHKEENYYLEVISLEMQLIQGYSFQRVKTKIRKREGDAVEVEVRDPKNKMTMMIFDTIVNFANFNILYP